jgi:hypothetical protein
VGRNKVRSVVATRTRIYGNFEDGWFLYIYVYILACVLCVICIYDYDF